MDENYTFNILQTRLALPSSTCVDTITPVGSSVVGLKDSNSAKKTWPSLAQSPSATSRLPQVTAAPFRCLKSAKLTGLQRRSSTW